MKRVTLPTTLVEIGEGAFRDCSSLETLTIPDGIKEIPAYMCAWDEKLKEVVLPQSIIDIGRNAFAYCINLSSIDLPGDLKHIGPNAFSYCKSLEEVTVPDMMEELESYAFSGCEKLRRAQLPGNSNMLGEMIFTGCTGLREIICMSPVPPTFDCDSPLIDPSEKEILENIELTIPEQSKKDYESAPGWNLFFQNP